MAQVVITRPEPDKVTMYQMKQGDFGVVIDKLYNGLVVFCETDLSTPAGDKQIRVVALSSTNTWWNNSTGIGGVEVEILPKGSVITLTV